MKFATATSYGLRSQSLCSTSSRFARFRRSCRLSANRETHVAPFIEAAAIESAATARRDDAKVFLREFTRELVREIKPSTKLVTLFIAVALVGGMLYLGFAMYKELQRSRRLIDEQRVQLGQMRDQVSRTNDQLTNIDESTRQLQASLSLAVKLRSEYGSGVCLIAGSYYFVEAGTGRPLRFAEAQLNDSGGAIQSSGAPESLTPEGNAAIAEYEFVGTGFHVGGWFCNYQSPHRSTMDRRRSRAKHQPEFEGTTASEKTDRLLSKHRSGDSAEVQGRRTTRRSCGV